MTDTALPSPLTLSSGVERMFPTLTPAQVKRIAAHGKQRSIRSGEVLIEAGARAVPFFFVTAGGGGGGPPFRRTQNTFACPFRGTVPAGGTTILRRTPA